MARKRYCPLAGRCGGCSYVNIDYRDELLSKYILEEKFLKSFCSVSPILPSDPYIGYRCKVQAVCGMDGPALVTGIYRRGSHKLIPVRDCLLEDPRASGILASVRTLARRFSLPAYDEDLDSGELRHVLIRIGARTGEALVALVTAHGGFRGSHDFAAALHQRHPYIRSVVAIRNREKTSMVIPADAEQKVLYGSDHIIDEMLGLRFRISAKSFYQVNPYQAELLYQVAMNMAELREDDVVIDAYSGTGTIALIAASMGVRRVIGIEANPDAVRDAEENARLNGIANCCRHPVRRALPRPAPLRSHRGVPCRGFAPLAICHRLRVLQSGDAGSRPQVCPALHEGLPRGGDTAGGYVPRIRAYRDSLPHLAQALILYFRPFRCYIAGRRDA